MSNHGQASGDGNESSAALNILYVGHRNSCSATLATDGFTQVNPPIVPTSKTETLSLTPKYGILSGSVAFTRPDAGNGMIGGPLLAAPAMGACKPLGIFINDAAGNAYENTPAAASGQAPYVSSQGTMGTRLYETKDVGTGADITYAAGDDLYASVNGYLTNVLDADNVLELAHGAATATLMGVVKVAPDSKVAEIVFDLRV